LAFPAKQARPTADVNLAMTATWPCGRCRGDRGRSLASLALALLLWLAAACELPAAETSANAGAPRDLQTIVADGVLRVAMTRFDLPPFHHRRGDGLVAGPEADLARGIARALNVEVAFVTDAESFDAVVQAVANGRADIGISKLSKTYYRLMRVRFSDPYITLRHSLLYNRARLASLADGRAPAEVLRDFHGSIAVIAGSAYADFARRNFPHATVIERQSWTAVVDALRQAKVDAIYRDEFETRMLLKKEPSLNVGFGAAVISDQFAFLSVAVCDSCAKLQEFINYHLEETRGTFTLKGLLGAGDRDE